MASNASGVRKVKINKDPVLRGPVQGPPTPVYDMAPVEGGMIFASRIGEHDSRDITGVSEEGSISIHQPPAEVRSSDFREPEIATGPTGETDKLSKYADAGEYRKEQMRLKELSGQAEIASGILKTLGGVVNAQSKFASEAAKNSYNIQAAEIQIHNVYSDMHYKMLKEQTKGKAKGQSAQLSAVAQGQAAGGDLAQTAMSNEAVYAAENMMNMEINSMRQVFGLESTQRQLASNTRLAKIDRNLEMSQAIISGGVQAGFGYAGLPET